MASTATVTPSMLQLGDDLRMLEYSMITSVVSSRSGRRPEILDFQQFVNRNAPMLNEALRQFKPDLAARGVRFVKLVEDGAWGGNTAAALTMGLALTAHRVITMPPVKSAGVPAWYVLNKEGIDELLTSVSTAGGSEVVAQAQAAASLPSAPVPAAAELPPEIQEQINGSGAGAITSSVLDPGSPQTEVTFDIQEAASTPTYGTSRKGGVPWVAVGGAAVVLVGALWMMGRKTRRTK